MEDRAKKLQERIIAAFASVPMPPPESLNKFDSLDERWCAEMFGGKHRNDINEKTRLIEWCWECCMHMPAPAAHYYFPALLLFTLDRNHRDDVSTVQSTISYLDQRQAGHTYPDFTPQQRECLIDWLQFVYDNMLEYGEDDPAKYDFGRYRDRYERRLPRIKEQWLGD